MQQKNHMPKRKTLIKHPRRARLILLVNAALLFFLALAFGREYVGNLQIRREIAELERQQQTLQGENLAAIDLIDQLSSEYYLERQAREKQGLARPGETLIIVKEDLAQPRGTSAVENMEAPQVSNPQAWFYYFFVKERYQELQSYAEGN